MVLILCAMVFTTALAYFLGATPFAIVVGRATSGVDVRNHGSGNTGATNVIRVLGWKVGVPVFLLDTFKGAIACLITMLVFRLVLAYTPVTLEYRPDGFPGGYHALMEFLYELALSLSMVASVVGHMFSPFLHFKGGKGVATTLGSALVVVPNAALCALAVFIICALLSRYISVGSISGSIMLPVMTVILYTGSWFYLAGTVVMCALIIYGHRANIARLRAGTESRFSAGRSKVSAEEEEAGRPAGSSSCAADTVQATSSAPEHSAGDQNASADAGSAKSADTGGGMPGDAYDRVPADTSGGDAS